MIKNQQDLSAMENDPENFSYFEKEKRYIELIEKEMNLNNELNDLKKKIKLITSNDLDYLDMLYREKLKYGKEDEILIKLK